MNRLLSIFTTLLLALWAGSLVHLVLTVSSLFKAFPKATSSVALEAAPQVFWITERYHLALALLSVLSIVAWRLVGCTRAKRWMMVLTIVATLLAFAQTYGLSAKMDALRGQGQSGGPAFTSLHHWSTRQYSVQTILVVAALCFLPAAVTGRNDQCAIDTVPGSRPA
jgi:hypothetical protein